MQGGPEVAAHFQDGAGSLLGKVSHNGSGSRIGAEYTTRERSRTRRSSRQLLTRERSCPRLVNRRPSVSDSTADGDVPGLRIEGGEVTLLDDGDLMRPGAKTRAAYFAPESGCRRPPDVGGKVVGSVVIDRQDLVVGVGKHSAMQFRLMAARFGRL